tara:strand:- start:1220 stop:1645 length:426 start_codon:yes stop_codon:yes gene_type:complete
MFFNTIDKKANNILSKFHFISIFFLRVSLGIAFIIYGYSKFPLPPQKLMEYFNFSPFLASFVAVSELLAGILIILGGFLKSGLGNVITRFSALVIVVIMIFAFSLAHKDWFVTKELFTSEQIFLIIIGLYFLINGNQISQR